jgi:hypothetical protein
MTFLCSRFKLRIPLYLLMPIIFLVEWSYKKILSRFGMHNPSAVTSTTIKYATVNRTFTCNNAAEQLGYKPIVSLKVCTTHQFSSVFLTQHLIFISLRWCFSPYKFLGGSKDDYWILQAVHGVRYTHLSRKKWYKIPSTSITLIAMK